MLAVMAAFKRARCQCTSYWQCKVLYGYMGKEKYEMINPFPQPNEERFERTRAVPYVDPPVPLAQAEKAWFEEKEQKRKAIISPMLLQTSENKLQSMEATSANLAGHSEGSKRLWRKARALKASNFGSGIVVGSNNLSYEAVAERGVAKSKLFANQLKEKTVPGVSLRSCCQVVLKYQIVPHGEMRSVPEKIPEWWDKKNCESIVEDTLQCEALLAAEPDDEGHAKKRILAANKLTAAVKAFRKGGANWTQWKKTGKGPLPVSTMHFYSIVKSGVDWQANPNQMMCNSYVDSQLARAEIVLDTITSIRRNKPPKISSPSSQELYETIVGRLNHCKRKGTCGVVTMRLVPANETDARGSKVKSRTEICILKYPMWPVPAKPSSFEGEEDLIAFQLNRKHLYEQGKGRQQDKRGSTLMKKVMGFQTTKAHDKLADHFLESCRCATYDVSGNGGCQAFYDNNGKAMHWCEVAPLSINTCRQQGYKLFKLPESKDGKERYWTSDLCQRSSCACSNIGMPSTSMHTVDTALLANMTPEDAAAKDSDGASPLVYGTECQKWDKADTQPWCYVGYDSTCPDREKITGGILIPVHRRGPTIPGAVSQYKSTYACVSHAQSEAIVVNKDRCQVYVAIPVAISTLLTIMSVIMMVVVYKFLIRRCGDNFAIEQQFEAYFSSEDEGDDDFDVDARRSSRKSLAESFASQKSSRTERTETQETHESETGDASKDESMPASDSEQPNSP